MSVLNEAVDALRRATGVIAGSPQAALQRLPGIASAISSVDTALGAVGVNSSGARSGRPMWDEPDPHGPAHPPDAAAGDRPWSAPVPGRTAKPALIRPGRSEARWENPIIDAAMPILLRLDHLGHAGMPDHEVLRSQLALEMRLFRDRVSKSGFSQEVVADSSYLLCTYVDELVNDKARAAGASPYNGESSLLVQFHGDAWGGEDAFSDLERWMAGTSVEPAILAFYELVLSLGWEGRYRVMERGGVLLRDLRVQLHAMVWNEHRPPMLADPVAVIVPMERKRWLTAGRAFGIAACALLALYAAWIFDLDMKGRSIREAIAAWDPPMRTINLADTLPPPLPRLLSEGWVSARKDPQGWLLAFKSDRAFDVGQANVRSDFRHQLDRLGAAFAPWPGDMEVVGHSDSQPIKTKQFPDNQALSQERARVVTQELLQTASAGGPRAPATALPRQITWSGKGDADPLDPAKTALAYERNRRVEILWKVAHLGPQSSRAVER